MRLAMVGGPEGTSHRLDRPNAGNSQFCAVNIRAMVADHAKKYALNVSRGLVLTIGFEEVYGGELQPGRMRALESHFLSDMDSLSCKVIVFPEGARHLSPFYGLQCELQRVLSNPRHADRCAKVAKCLLSKSEGIEEAAMILGIDYRQLKGAPSVRLR